MRPLHVLAAAAALTLAAPACITHLPPNQLAPDAYNRVAWADDFDEARASATALGRPMAVFMVAGELEGFC